MRNQEMKEPMAAKRIVIEDEDDTISQDPQEASSESDDEIEESAESSEPADTLEDKLAKAEEDARDYHDRMLRMAAELENFKKRSAREVSDLKKFATENLLRQLLTVVDNLERAIASASTEEDNHKSVVDGVALTLDEIMKILEKQYVSPIQALGEPFDPAFHQAMSQEENAEQPPNTVIKEFQKGYMIHDRLLRPSMVVVSKALSSDQAET
jgi:molecular chaperone GrpE